MGALKDSWTVMGASKDSWTKEQWRERKRQYSVSEHWKFRVRPRHLAKYPNCLVCGMTREDHIDKFQRDIIVHHRNYNNDYQERNIDLATLCSYHHDVVEGRVRVDEPLVLPDCTDEIVVYSHWPENDRVLPCEKKWAEEEAVAKEKREQAALAAKSARNLDIVKEKYHPFPPPPPEETPRLLPTPVVEVAAAPAVRQPVLPNLSPVASRRDELPVILERIHEGTYSPNGKVCWSRVNEAIEKYERGDLKLEALEVIMNSFWGALLGSARRFRDARERINAIAHERGVKTGWSTSKQVSAWNRIAKAVGLEGLAEKWFGPNGGK
jgi:hypothetical protein